MRWFCRGLAGLEENVKDGRLILSLGMQSTLILTRFNALDTNT